MMDAAGSQKCVKMIKSLHLCALPAVYEVIHTEVVGEALH